VRWPGSAPVPVFEFRPASATWGTEFLGRVAQGMAYAPIGLGLLIERQAGRPSPILVPSTPEGAMLIASAADDVPGSLVRLTGLPSLEKRTVDEVAFAVLAPASPGVRRRRDAGDREDGPGRERRPVASPFRPAGERFDRHLGASVQWHWFPGGVDGLRVWARVRLAAPPARLMGSLLSAAVPLAEGLGRSTGTGVQPEIVRDGWRARRAWEGGTLPGLCAAAPIRLPAASAAEAVPGPPPPGFPRRADLALHTVVVGASGSGKTSLLASVTASRVRAGDSVVVVDVHGDLAPATATLLAGIRPDRWAAVDAEGPPGRICGVRVLAPDSDDEAEAQELVAAFKRLSSEGSEVYWGFRLERVFDTFVRLTLEEGGDLGDLAELLTDPRRRDAARLGTRRPEIARFLEELPAIERRSPEFLWPAAARVSKVLLSDRLRSLLAPPEGGVELGPWLGSGGSILLRLPFRTLGPEASGFAATLLATRAYLAAVRRPRPTGGPNVLFVLDEAHAFSPRLVAEILAEGRKFGVALLLATQYPERWSPELRAAAAGAAGSHVLFRVPAAAARTTGPWLGLSDSEARQWLPVLPVGHALAATPGVAARLIRAPPMPAVEVGTWEAIVEATRSRCGGSDAEGALAPTEDDQLLFAVWEAQERGVPMPWHAAAEATPPALIDGGEGPRSRIVRLVRRGWLEAPGGSLGLTAAGARAIGVGGPTGAPSESAEHRALLVEAARIFLRHGLRLEPVRQGRFDTRLPDGRVRIAAGESSGRSPRELLEQLESRRKLWGWRYFRGRDVHVEAEVSGALRPDRIRRGLSKGERAGAFVLFLVADTTRARRVRATLSAAGAYPLLAGVWTLPRAARRAPEDRLHR
jgi:hypothetical protein